VKVAIAVSQWPSLFLDAVNRPFPYAEPMSTDQPTSDSPDRGRAFSIEVSDRIKRLPPYLFARINKLMYEKRRAGEDVIDLGMGNPSDPPQDIVIEKLAEAARDPANHGYSANLGLLNLRRDVAAKYVKQYGVRLDPEREVIVCLGSKDGFSHMCLALVGHGDNVIVPTPFYPAHLYAVGLAGGSQILLEVTDPEKLLSNIAYTCQHLLPKPKLLIVNYPHNPTTTVVEPEFYTEVVKLAKRYGFMVISDLAYADITFDGYQTPSLLATPGGLDVGVELTTMSKGYNMAGWRIGFCVGNAEMIRALATIKTYFDYGMFQPIQIAAIMALRHTDAAVEAQAKIYEARRDVLCEGLERLGWPITRPKATMFTWAKIPEPWASQMNSFDFAMKLLEQCNVVASPGGGFGPSGEGHLRLAMVENEGRLRQAIRQIGRCFNASSPGT
jgi:alanine-synthesizing transaminase